MSDDGFPIGTVTWVTTKADLGRFFDAVETAEEVIIDLETTGLDEYAVAGGPSNGGIPGEIALASLTLPQHDDPVPSAPTTWLLPLAHPESPLTGVWRKVVRMLCKRLADKPLVNQNIKFDLRWLYAHGGIDLSGNVVWDTMLAAHLLDENRTTRLKARVPDLFGVPPWDDFDLSYPGAVRDVPLIDLGLYAARDTYWTWRWSVWQRDEMYCLPGETYDHPEDPEEIQMARLGQVARFVAVPTSRTLSAIEQRGIPVDRAWVTETLEEHTTVAEHLTKELADVYPMPDDLPVSFAPTSNYFRQWSEQAIKAQDLQVMEVTPNGKPAWTKSVLTKLARAKGEGSVADRLLELRRSSKYAEFLRSWVGLISPDGMIHSHYNVGSVVTGRLSSSEPNMQQVTKDLKPAFTPRSGYYLAEIDYSQIELRVAAFVSRCEPMMQAYRDGVDLHRIMAGSIVHKAPEDVTKVERQAGKAGNFGFLYGMGAAGFQAYALDVYGVQFTPEESQHVRDVFFSTWDGIAQWHARSISRAHQEGEVVSPIGRVRRVPEVWSSNDYLASRAERAAINSPVQGFASDLMQMAAASITGNLPGRQAVPGVAIVGTVHDSILVEVPQDDWQECTQACRDRMVNIGQDLMQLFMVNLDVPMEAEAIVGTAWGRDDVGVLD